MKGRTPSDSFADFDQTFWITICGEELFNTSSALNSSTPQFTDCLQHTVLVWPAAGFLLLGTIFQIYVLAFTPARGFLKWTWLLVLKMLINIVLFGITSANLGLHIALTTQNQQTDIASSLGYVLMWLCMLDLFILTECNRRRGRRASGVVWITWFILTICGSLQFSQTIDRISSKEYAVHNGLSYYQNILFLCYYPLVCLELILNSFADVYEYASITDEKECPESGSSFLCRITFSWFIKTAILGYKRSLTRDDLWRLRDKDTAEEIVPRWDSYWNKAWQKIRRKSAPQEPRRSSIKLNVFEDGKTADPTNAQSPDYTSIKRQECPSLVATLFGTVKWQFIPAVVIKLAGDLLSFVSPQILKILLSFIDSNPRWPLWIGLLFVFLMFLSSTVQSCLQNQTMYRMFNLAMNVRTALTSTVYRKALSLSTTARKDATIGEMVNLMAVDVQRMSDVVQWVQQLWATPIMIGMSLYFLYGELGYSALVGFCVMLVLMPCNFMLSRYQKRKQVRMMKFKDQRMKLMNEILNGMKVLKLYAWEPPFEKRVSEVREKELGTLKRGSYFDAINAFTLNCAPFFVAVASFATFVLSSSEHVLTPQKAFVSLSLFNILRQPLNMLPNVVSALVQASVSNKRLKTFLSQPQLNPNFVIKDGKQEEAILVQNGTFTWNDADDKATLNDINLAVKPGQLVAVVGPVGCGKSSLLSAILGDMEPRGGIVNVKGSVAYVPQQAWIQSLTLRNNIIFTKSYSETTYNRVVDSCALRPDFDILPQGDVTEIGEKGINLSGGQKQRVSLARAVYQDRDVYLMDDPLSAVDAHVGRHIFDKVIGNQGLLKGKTRVLVTHSLAYLKHMDNILVMKDGRITQSGTLAELLKKGGTFAEFLEMYLTQRSHDPGANPEDAVLVNELVEELQKFDPSMIERLRSVSVTSGSQTASRRGSQASIQVKVDKNNANSDGKRENGKKKNGVGIAQSRQRQKFDANIKHERVQKGKVEWRIYKDYISAVGYFSFLAIFFFFISSSSLGIGLNLWLSEWSQDERKPLNETVDVNTRLAVYASIGIGQGFFVFCAALTAVRVMVMASGRLHQQMLRNLMRTPMTFYDVTPLGAIISRVGKDVDIMDGSLPGNFRMWILQSLNVVSSVVVIMISTPIIAVAVVPLGLLYYFLQRFYVCTSRQLRRLESASRGPIYSHFGETLTGVTSIRAYRVENQFLDEAHYRLDENMKVVYASIVANRWLGISLQLIGNILVMFTALFAVLSRDSGVNTGLVGLSITYAMTITNNLQMSVRLSSDLEANIVAVERIKEYAELKNEAPWVTETRPPKGWPKNGVIEFDDYQLRYREGQDLVLRGVNWHIDAEEKVGVVGRTGAGKSSMTLALFRIVEPAGGKIIIDDVDISKIGLHDLRSRLAIIPQDPVLFSGTLRVNLDPFDEHHDTEVWAALEQAHLKPFVSQLADGLQFRVAEGGDNLSVGQRQLLCLARALLRRSKILVLDEATAAVDLETERLILDTIRNRFSDCTIITIAHRLNTIMDSDKILVMSQGLALEHGNPDELLTNPNSAFFGMAKDAGLLAIQDQSTSL